MGGRLGGGVPLPAGTLGLTASLPHPNPSPPERGFSSPLALITRSKNALRLAALCPRATALGLACGMPLADARALVPDLAVADADPQRDAAALDRLAQLCLAYTPGVSIDAAAGLVLLDIAGATHFWARPSDAEPDEAEVRLADDAVARLASAGFTARPGMGATPEGAGACALFGVDEADIGLLPPAALRLGEEVERALIRAGLTTIGAIAARPRAALAARFGALLTNRINRLLGHSDSRITPRRRPPPIIATARFAEPLAQAESLRAVLRDLAGQLATQMEERGLGGRRFVARFERSDHQRFTLAVETGAPTRDALLLDRLIAERIDALADPIDPGFGFDAVTLAATRHEVLGKDQLTLEGGVNGQDSRAAALAELIDRLGARLGTHAVRRFVPQDSHIPEQAALALPASAPPPPTAAAWGQQDGGWGEAGEPPLRPFHLFHPPQPVEVIAEIPDGPPRQFRWRRNLHHVTRYEGPERIAAEWWRKPHGEPVGPTRDYYRVEDTHGRRFWLFRHGLYGRGEASPRWYIHGLFA